MGQEEKKGRGTQLALILLCILVFVFACCAIVFVALYFIKYGENDNSDNVLTDDASQNTFNPSQADVNYASMILENADFSADPCEDFFAYSCSSYVRDTPIPEKGATGIWQEVSSSVNWRIKTALEKELDLTKLPPFVKYATDLYKSCMNEEKIEELGNAPLQEMLKSYGGFPAADSTWDPNAFDLTDLIAKTIRFSPWATLFFTVNVYLPLTDNSVHGMNMQQSYFFYPRYIYMDARNSTDLTSYEQYATDLAILLGADPAAAAAEMKAMVDWEVAMAPNQIPITELFGGFDSIKYITIADLYSNFTSKIDWIRLLDTIFEQTGRKFQMNETIEIRQIPWFERLSKKAETFGADDYRAIANGLLVRVIDQMVDALPKGFLEAKDKYRQARLGATVKRPRWETCASMSVYPTLTDWATARIYVEHSFDQTSKTEAADMMHTIRGTMQDLLDNAKWIDNTTYAAAKNKLTKMGEQIGYPDYMLDEEKLQSYYPDLTTNEDTFLENLRACFKNYKLYWLMKLEKPNNPEDWNYGPLLFNAAYFPQVNSMFFPAITFTPPIFHRDYLKVLNYAQAGFIMAHEITHGFDNQGRLFDEVGNFKNWWSPEANEQFVNQSQCYVDQYNKFKIAGEQILGTNSLGENIADHGGLVAAYKSYHKWLKKNGMSREPNLPGLKLTTDQTFFLSTGQWFCYTANEEILKRSVTNRHTTMKYRLIGLMQNMPQFAKAFNCPAGSYMNPEKRCDLWV